MQVPEYSDTADFMRWARENKRRADRLAKSAEAVMSDLRAFNHLTTMTELKSAWLSYGDD